MQEEIWKDIEGFEGYYQVSNLGRIRSLDRVVVFVDGRSRLFQGIIKSQGYNCNTGYMSVNLARDSKTYPKDVHRLVAKAFIPNHNNLPCVDHINCNKTDNRAENLRWCTHLQNVHFAIDAGHIDLEVKANILQRPDVRRASWESTRHPVMRSDGKCFDTVSEAAFVTGCSRRAITLVLNGTNKSAFGYSFKYIDK